MSPVLRVLQVMMPLVLEMMRVVQAMSPFPGAAMGEPYLGLGAAGGTESEGDVCDVPGDGEADDARGEGVVGDDVVWVMMPLVLPFFRVV